VRSKGGGGPETHHRQKEGGLKVSFADIKNHGGKYKDLNPPKMFRAGEKEPPEVIGK